jgi:hypothetical protein
MSEAYAAPSGPPPPKVPEGWKAVWNDQYKEWFYVNLHTKASQWDKPTEPALKPGEEAAPPGYSSGPNDPAVSDTKRPLESNNPYNNGGAGASETDEEMAHRLQNEEQHRSHGGPSPMPGGQSDSYYGQNQGQGQYPQGGYQGGPVPQSTDRGVKSGGLLGKLASKLSSKSSGGHGYPQQQYGGGYGQ